MALHEGWTTTATSYSLNVGRTSALAAARLTEMANAASPFTPDSRILDSGAGTGAVTFSIASSNPSAHILATDISAAMLSNISSSKLPNVTTRVSDVLSMSHDLGQASFSHVFNTFVLQTILTPSKGLAEMYAVLLPRGGIVGIAVWGQRLAPYIIWERACQSIDPNYSMPPPYDDPQAWQTRGELETALREQGFAEVDTDEIEMPFPFESAEKFADFWFGSKNPGTEKPIRGWKGDMKEIRMAVEKVCREDFDDGRKVFTSAVLGIGRKT